MQVDPIKSTLKAPGTERLKLECDVLLSNFAFDFNVRRYTKVGLGRSLLNCRWFSDSDSMDFFPRSHELFDVETIGDWEAGAYTRPLF